jgi:hypothetical protein
MNAPQRQQCPICRRPLSPAPEAARLRPFCSKRCADIDLHRWLSGGYRVETDEPAGSAGDDGTDGR